MYADHEHQIASTADLFGRWKIIPQKGKTERGELLKYFAQKTGRKIGYIAYRLTGVPTEDLYAVKSSCDDYERRGNPWSKGFFGSLKVCPTKSFSN